MIPACSRVMLTVAPGWGSSLAIALLTLVLAACTATSTATAPQPAASVQSGSSTPGPIGTLRDIRSQSGP
jgi:hypothetical protein